MKGDWPKRRNTSCIKADSDPETDSRQVSEVPGNRCMKIRLFLQVKWPADARVPIRQKLCVVLAVVYAIIDHFHDHFMPWTGKEVLPTSLLDV